MKQVIILSAAMAFVTLGAFAQSSTNAGGAPRSQHMQSKGTPEERAKRQADRINATVQLSTDQYNKVLDVSKNFTGQRDALKASTQGDDLRTKFKALGEQENAQLKSILTADQYTKLQAARKDHTGHNRGE